MNVDAPTAAVELVHRFWERMQSNDFRQAAQLLREDIVVDWPQSGERIRGRAAFAAVQEEYPSHGRWLFDVLRVVGNDREAVSDVAITDGVQRARAISFFTVLGGEITAMTEFWPEPFDPPTNRRHLVETIEP